jgi:hypothetical protein
MVVLAALFLILVAIPRAATAQGDSAPTDTWAHDALTRALAASDEITDSFHRVQVLAEISEAQAGVGDTAAARANLQKATQAVGGIDEDALRSWALHDIGLAYVKIDDLAAAEASAEAIRDPRLHDVVLTAVVDARRATRDVSGAQATASLIRDGVRRGQSLRAVAVLQASGGDFSGALLTARGIQHSAVNGLALGDVAAAIARDGSFEEARSLVSRIRDTRSRSRGFAEIAAAQASLGDVHGALTTAQQADDKLARAEAFARIASSRVSVAPAQAQDLFAQSLALVAGARASASRKCDTLTEIARAQLAAGDVTAFAGTLKQVFDALGNVRGESDRLGLLSRIAPLQARAGDYPGAFATVMRADDRSLRPLLARDIAASQAETGDVAGAVGVARSLDDRPAAAAALFGILRVQSQAHDVAGVQETIGFTLQAVRLIASPELRADALGSLAATNALQGDLEAGHAMFAEAMSTAAAVESPQQRAEVYARIADSLADRHRSAAD